MLILIIIIVLLAVGGTVVVRRQYSHNLQPVGTSKTEVYVTIPSGSSASDIAQQLYSAGLIRNAKTFEWYVNTHNIREKLQAGTYGFTQSMTTDAIAEAIARGDVATDLVTIIPGQRLDQVKQTFVDAGFSPAAVNSALVASRYRGTYPALADNPKSANLEGFLYPDSYQRNADTDPSEIVAESLVEMQKYLTSDIRSGFAKQGLSVFQGVSLASIVEQEVPGTADRAKVAQVFLLRLKRNMTLGSDVTVVYSKAVKNSKYDTTEHKGLPPGPIGSVSKEALNAVAHPANTDWLFFVTGDNGKTYFSHTYDEHKANIAKYCREGCPSGG